MKNIFSDSFPLQRAIACTVLLFLTIAGWGLVGCAAPVYQPTEGAPKATLQLAAKSPIVQVHAFANRECESLESGSLLAKIWTESYEPPKVETVSIDAGNPFVFSFNEYIDHGVGTTSCTATIEFLPVEGEKYRAAFAGWPLSECRVKMYSVHKDEDGSDYLKRKTDFSILPKNCSVFYPW